MHKLNGRETCSTDILNGSGLISVDMSYQKAYGRLITDSPWEPLLCVHPVGDKNACRMFVA